MGFTLFGKLDDCPPGHDRLYFRKRFDAAPRTIGTVSHHPVGSHGISPLGIPH